MSSPRSNFADPRVIPGAPRSISAHSRIIPGACPNNFHWSQRRKLILEYYLKKMKIFLKYLRIVFCKKCSHAASPIKKKLGQRCPRQQEYSPTEVPHSTRQQEYSPAQVPRALGGDLGSGTWVVAWGLAWGLGPGGFGFVPGVCGFGSGA